MKVLRVELLLALAAAIALAVAAVPPALRVEEAIFLATFVTVPAGAFDIVIPAGVSAEAAT